MNSLTDTRWPATERLCKKRRVWSPTHVWSDLCTEEPAVSSSCFLQVPYSSKPALIDTRTVLLLFNNSAVMTEIGVRWKPAKPGLPASWHTVLCDYTSEMIAHVPEGDSGAHISRRQCSLILPSCFFPLCEIAGCGHRTLLLIAHCRSRPHISPHPVALLF